VADAIKERSGLETVLESGHKGEFTVWVDDHKVADKVDGEFPEDSDCVDAVQAALQPA